MPALRGTHISIILIGINSCSTNLQHIGGWRHREQKERQASNDWLTCIHLGQAWHLVPLRFSILMNVEPQAATQNLPHLHLNLQEELQWEQELLRQRTDSEY